MTSQPGVRGLIRGKFGPARSENGIPGPQSAAPPLKARRFGKRVIALTVLGVFVLAMGIAYTQKDRYTDRIAGLSRELIGDENTARVESWYFATQDRIGRLKYRVFGGSTSPFGEDSETGRVESIRTGASWVVDDGLSAAWGDAIRSPEVPQVVAPQKPAPLTLPLTRALRPNLQEGEGVWTTAGLPRSSPDDVLMAKTFIKPDTSRPYATVGVLLLDKRRIRLHLTGGTEDPGGDRGVRGPGAIPVAERKLLLAAWNGGFKGPHGGFGMYADGKQYRPLRNGLASVAVTQDGTMKMGEWGRDLLWSDDTVSVRQNAALLVDNCEVSKRTNEGNNTWGYVEVNSAEFITWRSAVGLTQNGDLLVAAGNSLSAATLARALWAAGACYAMQLDINSPYVLTSLYFPQPDGSVKPGKFMDSMPDNPGRFFSTQQRDFMYVTLDESKYVP
ncbi:MAG TPA: hypothetical protein VJB57_16480 [Dehalococcoidia bacterium]|nr:hypothetical protein [Dehalococcoidia bacterium]